MNSITHQRSRRSRVRHSRRAIVLVLVMVVVTMVSLAGFSFVASMSNENKAVHLRGEQLRMENAIASAEEFLKIYVQRSKPDADSTPGSSPFAQLTGPGGDNESLMRGVVVDEDGPKSRIRFTAIAPRYDETGAATLQYGLERESNRLDLRSVADWENRRPGSGKMALLGLPGMTESIADALLDWMDSDSAPRQSGAEMDFYASLNPPYSPRNGIPESLEELLLIKGITRELLFGRDADQNHRLDYEEQSSSTGTARDTNGERQWPWIELLTIYSNEQNRTRDGKPRINLNHPDIRELHRLLSESFAPSFAAYVVLFRQNGPALNTRPGVAVGTAPLDFTKSARYRISSALDLLQSRVQIGAIPGQGTIVECPLTINPEGSHELLMQMYDDLTVSPLPFLKGRVNINTAPAEVLRSLPGLDKALAEQIVAARSGTGNTEKSHDDHPYWIYSEGLVDISRLKELSPFLTVGGDTHRTQIVAFSERSRLSQRVELVLDASEKPTRRVMWKDLQVLGRGFPWDAIDTPGGISASQFGAGNAASVGY
ncbi:helix-hairpin-helix domain-containing protein [Schlesneria paludicola]|uniref:helix-hairpin-helix domain-containing protein n=1 Tax=Schlesneria paludicola TaxID=360056 RepID=UPI00029B4613|nr:helix-hairpin-helix domain-containing protein [Schlesneria paludicola]